MVKLPKSAASSRRSDFGAFILDLFDLRFPEQTGWPEQQYENEDSETNSIRVGGPRAAIDESLDDSQEQSPQRRARNVADASEDRRDEGFQSRQYSHERIDRLII